MNQISVNVGIYRCKSEDTMKFEQLQKTNIFYLEQ